MHNHGISGQRPARSQSIACAGQLAELAAAADRLAAFRARAAAEASARDELIAALRAADLPWADIAAAARLSVTRCLTIAAIAGASSLGAARDSAPKS